MSAVSAIDTRPKTDFDGVSIKAEKDDGLQDRSFYLEPDSCEQLVFVEAVLKEDEDEGEEENESSVEVKRCEGDESVTLEINNPLFVPSSKPSSEEPQPSPNLIKESLTSRLNSLLSCVDSIQETQSIVSADSIANFASQKQLSQSSTNANDSCRGSNKQNSGDALKASVKSKTRNTSKRNQKKNINSVRNSRKTSQNFRCTYCDEAFKIRSELDDHISNHHPSDPERQKDNSFISNFLNGCTPGQTVNLIMRKDEAPLPCNVTCNECSTAFYDVNKLLFHLSTYSLSSCRLLSKKQAESAKKATFQKTITSIISITDDSSIQENHIVPVEMEVQSCINGTIVKTEETQVEPEPDTTKTSSNFRCTDCDDDSFRNLIDLQDHILSHHASNPKRRANISAVSDSYIDDMLGISSEIEEDCDEKQLTCEECSVDFSDKKELRKHMQTCGKEKRHACPHCPSKFYRSSVLRVHLRSHTGEKPYICTFCNARFNQQSGLTNHLRTHTGDKPFSCPQCSASFTQNCNLVAHLRLHTGEKPFKCDKCPAEFIRKQALQTHSWKHGGEKPLKCKYCPARFSVNCKLRNHLRKHTGEKPFICSDCSAAFANKRNLQVHIRTHTGEKPYSCTYCDAKFSLPLSYKIHLRTHTGEKPYLCDYCGAKSNNLSNMRKHVRTHTGDKPYLCSHCGARFNQKSSLELHLKAKKHSQ